MRKKNSLYHEIQKFQLEKKIYAIILILLGIVGLIFPIIPGLFLIGLGILLISPKYGEMLLKKIKQWLTSFRSKILF